MTDSADAIEVPYDSLYPNTLRTVVEEFITRAGTDYGERERTLEEKVADVMRQLRRGEAKVVFDPRTNTVNIVPGVPPAPVTYTEGDDHQLQLLGGGEGAARSGQSKTPGGSRKQKPPSKVSVWRRKTQAG